MDPVKAKEPHTRLLLKVAACFAVTLLVMVATLFAIVLAGTQTTTARASALEQTEKDKGGMAGVLCCAPAIPPCSPDWVVVSTPNYGHRDYLTGVTALSESSVWAVGVYYNGSTDSTVAEHWNGDIWSISPTPNIGTGNNHLNGVAAVSEDDVWGVGFYYDGQRNRTLIEHWDGSAWSVVPSPNPGTKDDYLQSVAALSASDVWAAGYAIYDNGAPVKTLIEHWDGNAWSVTSTPYVDVGDSSFKAISAASASDVWAVGVTTIQGASETLTEHWDGTIWSVVPSPNPGMLNNFYSVAAIAEDDVWAVGDYNHNKTLTEHWDGHAWSVTSSPNVYLGLNTLQGVAAVSSSDVWAVGLYADGSGWYAPLVEHWDGSSWRIVYNPKTSISSAYYKVAALSTGEIWGVGTYNSSSDSAYTLVGRYNPCISSCPLQFQDVPVDQTFYPYTRCLACRNIISGYLCGGPGEPCVAPNNYPYFRPSNSMTRGEIAKVVALSAHADSAVSGQTFEDVPPGSPFYTYIEELVAMDVMNGYPCGDPEPCVPPLNRAYFRPNSNASRGQLAKIASNAAGLNQFVGGQFFEDVPPASPFYTYTYRLYNQGVVQGYACGGPGEPCNPRQSGFYFRPAEEVSRGQTSKIIGNTFYPYCYSP